MNCKRCDCEFESATKARKFCDPCRILNRKDYEQKYYKKTDYLPRQVKAYGITVDDFQRMMEEQNGCCAICELPCPVRNRLAIDHDHVTDKVRGLLCTHCNVALGQFKDNIDLLEKAIAYLRKH